MSGRFNMTSLALGLLCMCSGARADNLVQNGGFETGDFSDWTLSGGTDHIYVGNSPNAAHTGSYAAQLGTVGSDNDLSQTLTTTSGSQYTLDFWHIYAPNAGSPGDFSVQWDGDTIFGPVESTDPPSPQTWTEYSFSVTGTGMDTLTFVSRNDPSYQRLDDVSVSLSTVPLPGSAPLFGAALLALASLGYGIRRRGAKETAAA